MSTLSSHEDPWETPPVELDPDLVGTSQQLMAKSELSSQPIPEDLDHVTDEQTQKILDLEQQNQSLFQRNVNLVTQVARLEAANQQLMDRISQLQHQPHQPWLLRLWGQLFQGKPTHGKETSHQPNQATKPQ